MQDVDATIKVLGNQPPLDGDGRNVTPDRREISMRWLSGTFLTGLTSSILMGVALFAALDGREILATPPELGTTPLAPKDEDIGGEFAKLDRVAPPRVIARESDRRRMEVSTVSRQGDREVIRMVPFMHLKMTLTDSHSTNRRYPSFDPLEVFAEDASVQTANTGMIYGAKVESEVSLRSDDFPLNSAAFDEKSELSADEVEDVVRTTAAILVDGAVQVASLHYVDEERFGDTLAAQTLGSYGIRIVPENMSTFARSFSAEPTKEFAEEIIVQDSDTSFDKALEESGYSDSSAKRMAESLEIVHRSAKIEAGTVLRLGLEIHGDQATIRRASLYAKNHHVLTVAVDDHGQYVPGREPEPSPQVASAFGQALPVHNANDLPNVYDGLNRAALAYGMSPNMTRRLVKLLASDVDYQAKLTPGDGLEVLFSQPDEQDGSTEESEILFVSASFNSSDRSYYRFQMEDGTIDYFDHDGRSGRQFLLRNPVPNGRFNNGFGGRRHPILGYTRMHTGVDWSAPRGTPIIASGNGTVEKAGWSNGYGRQTIIRHANGYESSYSHQNAIAAGVTPGAKVRQGQVIGYVGSTGLSTGNHLHYEVIVNGTKVDPMRVRLPDSRVLANDELENFKKERDRIDTLLAEEAQNGVTLAAR